MRRMMLLDAIALIAASAVALALSVEHFDRTRTSGGTLQVGWLDGRLVSLRAFARTIVSAVPAGLAVLTMTLCGLQLLPPPAGGGVGRLGRDRGAGRAGRARLPPAHFHRP